jgi:hypothetical protein
MDEKSVISDLDKYLKKGEYSDHTGAAVRSILTNFHLVVDDHTCVFRQLLMSCSIPEVQSALYEVYETLYKKPYDAIYRWYGLLNVLKKRTQTPLLQETIAAMESVYPNVYSWVSKIPN